MRARDAGAPSIAGPRDNGSGSIGTSMGYGARVEAGAVLTQWFCFGAMPALLA